MLNTDNFVEKIRNVDLRYKIMVSFDVSSLFTNVLIEDTLNFLKNYLQSHTVDRGAPVEFVRRVKPYSIRTEQL